MRSSSVLSDTRLSLSFFLTTPAKKPRTECCCQSVAFMIAAMVVPFGCRSIPRTVCCFDEAVVDLREAADFGVVTLDAAADLVALRFSAGNLINRDCLVPRLAALGFDLLVAIGLSLMSTTASGAATDTSPAIGRGESELRPYACDILLNKEPASCGRGRWQFPLFLRCHHTRFVCMGSRADPEQSCGVVCRPPSIL